MHMCAEALESMEEESRANYYRGLYQAELAKAMAARAAGTAALTGPMPNLGSYGY